MATVHMRHKYWPRTLSDKTSARICLLPVTPDKTVVSSDPVLLPVGVNQRGEIRVVLPLPHVLLHSFDAHDHVQL